MLELGNDASGTRPILSAFTALTQLRALKLVDPKVHMYIYYVFFVHMSACARVRDVYACVFLLFFFA